MKICGLLSYCEGILFSFKSKKLLAIIDFDKPSQNLLETDLDKAKQIFAAIKDGNLSEVERSLSDINHINPIIKEKYLKEAGHTYPLTALHVSAAIGQLEIFKSISKNLINKQF